MKIGIIGGGAAGMMAAAAILEKGSGNEVFLIEKNKQLGRKVIISGGGRCNVTTGLTDMRELLSKYPRGTRFLRHALYSFPPQEVMRWFEQHGVPLKVEDDLRVFPRSDRGEDVVGVFEKLFEKSRVHLMLGSQVETVSKDGDVFKLSLKGHPQPLHADALVITTGGQAYRQTGSTGDGYSFAQTLGHTVTALTGSLLSFVTEEKWSHALSGLSFEKAQLTLKGEKNSYKFTGPFLFTHKGLSGPAVFALSALAAFEECGLHSPRRISIDILPDINEAKLEEKLLDAVAKNPRKNFKNTLAHFCYESLAEVACTELKINIDQKNANLPRTALRTAAQWLKHISLTLIGRGAGDEFVTAGGVELSEVNPQTMESKICPNLYFAGEVLNVDGFTGGFNLQASWATGRLAGQY